MLIRNHIFNKFLSRYKRLKFVAQPVDGGVDYLAYNYQNRCVLSYTGRKSSILLLNHLYTVNSDDKTWLDKKLKELCTQEIVSV